MDPHICSYVIQSGFYGLYRIGQVTLNWALITSMVERWHLETHTFRLLIGEMTVTLQDVAIILGLRIRGPPVTNTRDFDVSSLCQELLGMIPPPTELRGSAVSTQWLYQHLLTPPVNADEGTLECSARGFILTLLESFLFAASKGLHVHLYFLPLLRDLMQTSTYSWGSSVLAHLYRELCRASCNGATKISSCITLLQVCC